MTKQMKKTNWRHQYDRILKFWVKRKIVEAKSYKRYGKIDMPTHIHIETQTACNRKCSYCPNSIYSRGDLKNQKFMSMETINKILDDLQTIKYNGLINPQGYGEPMLDPRLFDIIKLIKKKLPDCIINLDTNGDYIKKDTVFPKELDMWNKSEHSDPNFEEKNILNNRGGLMNPKHVDHFPYCAYENNNMFIDYKGDMIVCCHDYFGQVVFGNVNKTPVMDIWNSERYKKIRQEWKRKVYSLDICKKCVGEFKAKEDSL